MATQDLALFPLNTVLFPGGEMGLRIFEARYLDMVSECSQHGSGFGICLILAGHEVGEPALPAAVGCEARITDFSSGEDGILVLSVIGERRFRAEKTRVRDNGLVLGQVRWLESTGKTAIQPEHELLALLLRRIVERAGAPHDQVDKHRFEDADWVSWRLAEWLPLSSPERQLLLQESDAHRRLQRLVELIPEHQTF